MRDLASRSFTGMRARVPVGLDVDGVTPPVRRRRFVRRSERYRSRLALRDESDEESGSEHGGKNKDKQKNGSGGGGNKKDSGPDTDTEYDSNSTDTDDDGDRHRSSTARPAPKPTPGPTPSLPPVSPDPQPGPPVKPDPPESGGGQAGQGVDPPPGAGQGSDGPPGKPPEQTSAVTSTVATAQDGGSNVPAETISPVLASETDTSTSSIRDAPPSSPMPLTTTSEASPTATDAAAVQDSSMAAVPMSKPPPSSAQETAPPQVGGKKPFPLPAAAVIGAVLSFLVVSAIVWGLWFWLRRRRRARAMPPDWDFAPPPKRMSGLSDSTYTVSTDVPNFISAAEARAPDWQQSRNPFAHPADERERDPFGGPAKLRRGGTLGTVSTMSV